MLTYTNTLDTHTNTLHTHTNTFDTHTNTRRLHPVLLWVQVDGILDFHFHFFYLHPIFLFAQVEGIHLVFFGGVETLVTQISGQLATSLGD